MGNSSATSNVTSNVINVVKGIKSFDGEKPEDFSDWHKKTSFILSMQRPDIFAAMEEQIQPADYTHGVGTDGADMGVITPRLLATTGGALQHESLQHGELLTGIAGATLSLPGIATTIIMNRRGNVSPGVAHYGIAGTLFVESPHNYCGVAGETFLGSLQTSTWDCRKYNFRNLYGIAVRWCCRSIRSHRHSNNIHGVAEVVFRDWSTTL